ncbi:MAG: triose-phosphate isomerase [Verrucomicrobia bacterium]|nr:triose-phosphate isomerase [Verrucomicrobiota bacterium]
MRKRILVANWKMHKTVAEAKDFLAQLKAPQHEVWIAPPFTAISALKGSFVRVGAQNMHEEAEGAFTGEISAKMILEAGATFVILGHSERRRIFGESNERILKKVERALASGLKPLLCIGETEAERAQGKIASIIEAQLQGMPAAEMVIAYEPVWAIGTGKTATPDEARQAHQLCRGLLTKMWGPKLAGTTPILYGGSVTPQNAAALLAQPDIDGALIGGASLNPQTFQEILDL